MKLVKYIGDIIDQTQNRKIKEKEFLLKLKQILKEAENFEKKLEIDRANSPILVAERIAKYKIKIRECKKCQKVNLKAITDAFDQYRKIGSVEEQFYSGKSFIISNPDQEINDLRSGKVMVSCKDHASLLILIGELYKVNK